MYRALLSIESIQHLDDRIYCWANGRADFKSLDTEYRPTVHVFFILRFRVYKLTFSFVS